MSLYICSLNSGSNGNCYYIGNDSEAILIDAGLSCRETDKRMKRLGLSMDKVRAVFISHEHSDHIFGLRVLTKKYNLPVYITTETRKFGGFQVDEKLTKTFEAYRPVKIGNLSVTAFPKFHDASDPYSFIVSGNQTRVGIFTDIGFPCEHVIRNFQQCHAAFLEANYDEEMLEHSNYPYYLKKRISGEKGHLSNLQALELFRKHKPAFMSHLLLSHLSKNNNSPELVKNLFDQHADGTEIIVASRYVESSLYHIQDAGQLSQRKELKQVRASQLELAFG